MLCHLSSFLLYNFGMKKYPIGLLKSVWKVSVFCKLLSDSRQRRARPIRPSSLQMTIALTTRKIFLYGLKHIRAVDLILLSFDTTHNEARREEG